MISIRRSDCAGQDPELCVALALGRTECASILVVVVEDVHPPELLQPQEGPSRAPGAPIAPEVGPG